MEVNWMYLGLAAFFAIILVIYLVRKNLKDEDKVTKSFNDEINTERKFKLDDNDD